jgi:hypothetical protein
MQPVATNVTPKATGGRRLVMVKDPDEHTGAK